LVNIKNEKTGGGPAMFLFAQKKSGDAISHFKGKGGRLEKKRTTSWGTRERRGKVGAPGGLDLRGKRKKKILRQNPKSCFFVRGPGKEGGRIKRPRKRKGGSRLALGWVMKKNDKPGIRGKRSLKDGP